MAPDGGPARQAGRSDFLRVFPGVALPMFLAISDQSVVATALPTIAASLGQVEQISLVVVGYLIAVTAAAPVYGRLGDRFGRRRLLQIALVIFILGSIVCALANSLGVLIAGRLLQGVGGGGLMTLSQALIGEAVAPRDRARHQGYLAAVGVTSNGLGPVLGGFLTEFFGWRAIFVFTIPLSLLSFWLISRLPKLPNSAERHRFDFAGLMLFTSFVVSLVVLLQQVQRFDMVAPALLLGLGGIALVSIVALIVAERRHVWPLIPVELFRDPTIWRAVAVAGCHGGVLVSLLTLTPLYLRVVHGISAGETGLMIMPFAVCIAIGSFATGRIVNRTGLTAVFPAVGLTVGAFGLMLIAAVAQHLTAWTFSVCLAAIALSLGTVMAVVQVSVQAAAGRSRLGAAAAAVQYCRSLGAATITALVTAALFVALSSLSPDAGPLFRDALQEGPDALQVLAPERIARVRLDFELAFRAGFLCITGVVALASVLMWTMPLRRI